MEKRREDLELILDVEIQKIKKVRKAVFKINKTLSDNKVKIGTFEEVSKGTKPVSSLDIPTLWAITDAVFIETGNPELNPKKWFTELEIKSSKSKFESEILDEARLMLPIAIPNVTQIDYENYIAKIDISFLVKMFHSQLILYEFDSQRSAKFDANGVPLPDVNMKSVKDISDHMLNGTYLPDMMTLNVYSDQYDAIDFNERDRILTINENAIITILDGFHRLQGGVRAIAINPELQQMMILSIRNYDADKARKYFGQINTINVVKKERLRELKSERFSDITVRDLQQSQDLRGKIASSSRIAESAGQLTTFDILSYAIDWVYAPKSRMEAREVAENLKTFYEYLVGFYADEFLINPNKYRKSNINHPLVFAAYVVIAKEFTNNSIALRDLKDYIDSNFDFTDENLLKILEDKRGMNNKRVRDNVLNYFSKRVKESSE